MEFIMEFFSILVVVVLAMWVGWHVRGIVMLANLSENPDRVIKMLQEIKRINEQEKQEVQSKVIGVEIKPERVGNMWYAYAADNDQFLGQGPTLDDALKMVKDRFPDKKFWCKKPNENNHSS